MRKVLKFVDHVLYKFMKWSLILLLAVGAFVYYRLELNPLPAESDQDEAMRPAAPPPLPQPARPPPTPSDLERMRRNEAELQAALDEARFHSRRPPAEARPARSAPAEPAAYEAMWGAPQFSDDSSDSSSSDSEDDVPFDFSTDSDSEDDA